MSKTIKFAAFYSILTGLAIAGVWAMLIVTGQMTELQTAPLTAYGHLAAEYLTALMLLAAGWGLLTKKAWAPQIHLASLGLLLYAVVQASGYYAQQNNPAMTGLFVLFILVTLFLIRRAARQAR